MAKKTRTELSTLAINTNLPDNTTELITPTTERAQLTDERESVVNYKDDLGGVSNAGKFITVATDGESLTMVDEPTGELSGSGVSLQVALWDGTKVLTGEAEFIYTAGRLELNKIEIKGVSPKLSINASTSGDPILDFQDSGNTKAELFYDTVFGDEKFVIRAYGVDTVFERAVGTPSLTISSGGAATFTSSAGITNGNGINLRAGGNTTSDGNVLNFTSLGETITASIFSDAVGGSSRIKSLGALHLHAGDIGISATNQHLTIATGGLVSIPNGVVFNNNSVTGDKTNVTLNDYEEGTWTPTIVTGGYSSIIATARYTRIGRLVSCIADIELSGTGTTAELALGGLPFTNLVSGYSANATYFQYINTDNRNLSVRTHTGASTLFFQIVPNSTGTGRRALGNDFSAGYCNVNVTYYV